MAEEKRSFFYHFMLWPLELGALLANDQDESGDFLKAFFYVGILGTGAWWLILLGMISCLTNL